jgi:N-acetylneuraminic acid mutarotase
VYGGFASTGSTTGAILGFDPAGGQLDALGALAVPVHDAAGVAVGGATLIFGGGSAVPVSVVQRIDSSAVARVVGNLPAARADLSAVSIGNSAIVIGGGAFGVLDRQILATEDGVHFRVLATLLVGVRYAAVAETGGLIYVIGGAGAADDRTEIQRIDPATGKVDVIGRMPQAISHASAIVTGGRILVVGGRSAGKAQDAIWQVDVGTGTTHLAARLPQPVSDFAAAVIGGTGYVIGGETSTQVASIVSIVVQ